MFPQNAPKFAHMPDPLKMFLFNSLQKWVWQKGSMTPPRDVKKIEPLAPDRWR